MSSMEDLKALAESIKKDCSEKAETATLLQKAIALYETYLASPDTAISVKAKSYFFEDFTSEIVQCLASLPALTKPDVCSHLSHAFSIRKA